MCDYCKMARPGQRIYINLSSLPEYERRVTVQFNRQTREEIEKDIRDDVAFRADWLEEIAGWQKMAEGFELDDENDEADQEVMLEALETMSINKPDGDEVACTPDEIRTAFTARNAVKSRNKRDENTLARGMSHMKVQKTSRRRTARNPSRPRWQRNDRWAKDLAEKRANVIRLYEKWLGRKRARLEEFDLAAAADRAQLSVEKQMQIRGDGVTSASIQSADADMEDFA